MTGPGGAELPPFCSRSIILPPFRLLPSQHGGGRGSMPGAASPPPLTPPPLVSLLFLLPHVSELATSGQVHIFSHKGNVDIYTST